MTTQVSEQPPPTFQAQQQWQQGGHLYRIVSSTPDEDELCVILVLQDETGKQTFLTEGEFWALKPELIH